MGLIYDPNDSSNLLSALNANINTANEMISGLKRGSKHLVSALDNRTLSGAAYTAGKGMFSQVVIPTISKASQALDKLRSEVKQYESFASSAGGELLDEDKLNTQLQSLQAQQVALTGQIGFYNQQALLHPDNSELMFTYKTFGQELSAYMSITADSIQNIQNKLRKLYDFNMNVSGLFRDSEATFANLSTVISAIGSGKFNSSGKFSMTCSEKDLVRINKFLSSKKTKDKREKKRKGFMIGKLFGVKHVTTDTNLTRDLGGSYKKVIRTDKDKGIFSANYKDGKFSGCSVELGGVSVDVDGWWNLSVGANTKLFGSSINARLALNLEGIDGGIGFGNAQNQFNYGLKGQSDLANGLFAVYAKNKTIVAKTKNLETSVTTEAGKRFLNGKQAVTAGVVTAAIIIGAVKFGGGLATGHPDIAEQGLQDVRNGVGKIVWGY